MSNGNQDFSGSAARHHEETGGNAKAGPVKLPFGGDAARQSETDGESTNEAHGIKAAPRGQYRGTREISLPRVVGARMTEAPAPEPDYSARTAADYLPPQLKAQLIAEGRLRSDGTLVASPQAAGTRETGPAGATGESSPTPGLMASVAGFFRKLFR